MYWDSTAQSHAGAYSPKLVVWLTKANCVHRQFWPLVSLSLFAVSVAPGATPFFPAANPLKKTTQPFFPLVFHLQCEVIVSGTLAAWFGLICCVLKVSSNGCLLVQKSFIYLSFTYPCSTCSGSVHCSLRTTKIRSLTLNEVMLNNNNVNLSWKHWVDVHLHTTSFEVCVCMLAWSVCGHHPPSTWIELSLVQSTSVSFEQSKDKKP